MVQSEVTGRWPPSCPVYKSPLQFLIQPVGWREDIMLSLSAFKSLCIWITGDFLYLSVFANCVLYFCFLLISYILLLSFIGNRCDSLLFRIQRLAKFKQRVFCRLSSVGKSKTCKDWLYDSYFLFKMSFANVFCVLSSKALSCSVSAPCQRTADCSRTTNNRSSIGGPFHFYLLQTSEFV